MFKSGALLTAGNMASALVLMLRNIIIARLISVADMGVASTFAITMAVLEMMSDFALNQLLIQDRDGDSPRMKAILHAMQVIRGLITGAILYLFAAPYAALLSVPDIAWAFQLMAIIPVIRGFIHLDIFQVQRVMNYLPFVTATLGSQIVAVALVFPLAMWTGDWRVMLYALLIQHGLFFALSHVVAKTPYRLAWDNPTVLRALKFGWPLLLNGGLIFAILCGDRVIVANVLTMTDLGLFAMAYTMSMAPTLIAAKTLQAFFLPQLAAHRDDPAGFERLYFAASEVYLVAGAAFAVGIALVGGQFFVLLLGEKYAPALTLLVWLSIGQAIRLAKGGASVAALAGGHTRNPMISNVVRALALPVAYWAVLQTGDALTLAYIAVGAEALSYLVSLWLLKRQMGLGFVPMRLAYGAAILVLVLVGWDVQMTAPQPGFLDHPHLFQLVLLAGFAGLLAVSGNLRRWLRARLTGAEAIPPQSHPQDPAGLEP